MTLSAAATFAAAAAHAQRQSGVTVSATGHAAYGPTLAAGRFRLGHGLTVVLVANPQAPVFAYQTWFRVGSKHEEPHRTGYAHLFEHLMFKGTRTHAAGVFDREMERRGAQTNAATWVDWTYYTQALAARGDNLETVIAFEADRMVNLTLDEVTFRSELEVVKNERRMAVDDSVPGALGEALAALAYTQHPYRWPTIGSMAHLEAATVDDLRRFYTQFYAPNNATVVIVGDIDLTATLTALARAYGPLPAQPIVSRPRPQEPPQRAPRQASIRRPLLAPQLVMGYHAPPQGHPDFAALELLAEALVAGDSGRLYCDLVVEQQLAQDVGGFVAPFCEPGLVELSATARSGVDPMAVVRAAQRTLTTLSAGLTDAELDKGRHGLELALLDSLRDVEGCAEALGHYETNYGAFERAFSAAARWQEVTPAQLARVAASVFDPAGCSVVLALPEAAPGGAA